MRILSFLILAITGLAMAAPGLYLASLGGSLYYAAAGILILVSAWLILRRRPLLALLLVVTRRFMPAPGSQEGTW